MTNVNYALYSRPGRELLCTGIGPTVSNAGDLSMLGPTRTGQMEARMSSGAQQVAIKCPACGTRANQQMWLVVDAADRPDLIEKLRHGGLRTFLCGKCGRPVTTTTSLLVDSRRRSPLLFAVDPAADANLTREQFFASAIIHHGRSAGTGDWTIPHATPIPHDLLAVAVDRDVDDDIAAYSAGTWRAESIALQKYGDWLRQAVHQRRDAALKAAVQALIKDAPDAAGFARVVRAHPVLLSEVADDFLATLQDVSEEDAGPEYERQVAEWRQLLRMCRRDGVEAVLPKLRDA